MDQEEVEVHTNTNVKGQCLYPAILTEHKIGQLKIFILEKDFALLIMKNDLFASRSGNES